MGRFEFGGPRNIDDGGFGPRRRPKRAGFWAASKVPRFGVGFMDYLSKLLIAAEGYQDAKDSYSGPCLYEGEEAAAYWTGYARAETEGDS